MRGCIIREELMTASRVLSSYHNNFTFGDIHVHNSLELLLFQLFNTLLLCRTMSTFMLSRLLAVCWLLMTQTSSSLPMGLGPGYQMGRSLIASLSTSTHKDQTSMEYRYTVCIMFWCTCLGCYLISESITSWT